MPYDLKNRAGIGLPIAMGAMVIIGIVIAAGAFASLHDYRIDRNMLFQERALGAAEEGQARLVKDWSPAWNNKPYGDTLLRRYTLADGSVARVVATRLNQWTFSVASEGAVNQTSRQLNARRRTNLLLRLHVPNLRMPAAISARDATRATGSGQMDGNDVNPPGWDCDAPGTPAGAIATDSINDSGTAGACAGEACLTTAAPAARMADSVLRDTTMYGSALGWDELKALALTPGTGLVFDITATGGSFTNVSPTGPSYNADGSCNRVDPRNWGDINRTVPAGKCEGYFPTIYLRGGINNNAIINGNGSGQGILIVDGSLQINGNFKWYGPIIVRGNFLTNGTALPNPGVKIVGGVLAGNFNCNSSTPSSPCNNISGNTSMQFSRCALSKAVLANAKVVPSTRSWADLF